MSPPVMMTLPLQRFSHDCGICCLAALLSLPYETISLEALKKFSACHTRGLWTTNLRVIAKGLKYTLIKKTVWDDDDTGILVLRARSGNGHYVMLFQGVVHDPATGMVCDYETYLKVNKFKATALLSLSA